MNKKALKRKLKSEQTFTRAEVKSLIIQNAANHAEDVLQDYLACVTMVLRDDLGFGLKRIKQFHRSVRQQVECIQGGLVTGEDMFETLRKEVKFDFSQFMEELRRGGNDD